MLNRIACAMMIICTAETRNLQSNKVTHQFNFERIGTSMTHVEIEKEVEVQSNINNLEAQLQKPDPKLQYPQPIQMSTPQIKLLNI